MRKPLIMLLAANLVLAGCGGWSDARVNPRNWFGKSQSVATGVPTEGDAVNPLIPKKSAISKRPTQKDASIAISAITELRINQTTTGAIILATGIAGRQGAYDAELRIDPVDDETPANILSFTFRVVYPDDPTPAGSEHTRTVHVAHTLTTQDLRGIRLIRVRGEQNIMESRRH